MVDYAILNTNNLERGSSTVVKVVTNVVDTEPRGGDVVLKEGDFIFLGRTTEDALLGTPILMIDEDFPVGANIDFGYVTYSPEGPDGITTVHAAVPICSDDIANAAKMVRLPWSSKQANPDGSEYTGDEGIIWGGTALGCIYHGPDASSGSLKIVIPSNSFNQNVTGAYLTRGA